MLKRPVDKTNLPSRHVTEGPARAPHRSYFYAMGLGEVDLIEAIADVGLLLLLFTIGLKLDLKDIVAPQIWAVATLQIAIAVPLTTLVILVSGLVFPVLALGSTAAAWTLAFALSFSSTVAPNVRFNTSYRLTALVMFRPVALTVSASWSVPAQCNSAVAATAGVP